MSKVLFALVGVIALCATLVYIDAVDARCGGRAARVQARRSVRQGGCGSGSSMTYSETHTYQMRGGGMRMRAGGCN